MHREKGARLVLRVQKVTLVKEDLVETKALRVTLARRAHRVVVVFKVLRVLRAFRVLPELCS